MSTENAVRGLDRAAMTDATLVEQARDGDVGAFEALVDRYQVPIFRLVLRIVVDRTEAEDIAQDALITAWRRLDGIADPARFRPWVFQIASNRALDVIRERDRKASDSLDADSGLHERIPASAEPGPERAAITQAQWQTLSQLVAALPPRQRACWVLREFDEFSYTEIGHILHMTEAAVRGQLARARMALAEGMVAWK